MSDFSDQEKLACIEREIQVRRKVYPGRVKKGLMPLRMALREHALMEAIARDYRIRVQPDLALDDCRNKARLRDK
jgi:hypothetical protein